MGTTKGRGWHCQELTVTCRYCGKTFIAHNQARKQCDKCAIVKKMHFRSQINGAYWRDFYNAVDTGDMIKAKAALAVLKVSVFAVKKSMLRAERMLALRAVRMLPLAA